MTTLPALVRGARLTRGTIRGRPDRAPARRHPHLERNGGSSELEVGYFPDGLRLVD
jgi:hypothetical protein